MQEALLRLADYWSTRGCLIVQPMNTEVGAGTLNPATALRVLGPEPWRVAYVEPSVRPDDARYGENPNRLQTHTQFQVILKPEPGDPQQEYLGSLRALGIDIDAHDVRFVEDNWASPALGAWGLGWEVWLDGLEITQFTYFQQAGGMPLDPVSVELTYGMERIIMALQGVTHFKEIDYGAGISYGEAFGQAEYEMSRYYLDDADLDANRTLFDTYAAEADRMLEARLPVPAHSYVLKCSHAFNVLDSRGAISTTERARSFARMRDLSHSVATLWLERREELGHPLGDAIAQPPAEQPAPDWPQLDGPATLAFEIGVEELPASVVEQTAATVRRELTERLGASRLDHGEIRVLATPRRIAAVVEQVAAREPDAEQTVRGPAVRVAYDEAGEPTKAALGFARSQGIDSGELQRLTFGDAEHVGLVKTVVGRPATEVLAEILAATVGALRADRNMRWSAPGLAFSRPIRWLLALLGDRQVPLRVSTIEAGRSTELHRTAAEPVVEITTADDYLPTLERGGIVADPELRRAQILERASELAAEAGGRIDADGERATLAEVTNLVEQPTPILGGFDERYLELPAEVLTTVMKKHQRYLPVRDVDGRLLPRFVAVANGGCDHDAVRTGNEAVLRARYEDASFFWDNDLRTPPERLREGLAQLMFETRLGSVAERADRIARLADALAERAGLDGDARATVSRAGALAKFDLASEMVVELSSLAGVMAREYALRAGEPPAVADALLELELPRHAGDRLPESAPGALLALADRFDLLAGLFAIGSAPKGSSDPFALRRAALGVIGILLAHPELGEIELRAGLQAAAELQPVPCEPTVIDDALEFVLRRFEQHQVDAGRPVDAVRAVLPLAGRPERAARTAAELVALRADERFQAVVAAMQRARRIVPPETEPRYDRALFDDPAEASLEQAVATVRDRLPADGLPAFTEAATALVDPIERFFTDVLVMAEDPRLRANRLGLLAAVRDLGDGVIDWTALQ